MVNKDLTMNIYKRYVKGRGKSRLAASYILYPKDKNKIKGFKIHIKDIKDLAKTLISTAETHKIELLDIINNVPGNTRDLPNNLSITNQGKSLIYLKPLSEEELGDLYTEMSEIIEDRS